ncbi:MAG: autotransporter-associated beta strand repeat-containing protein [Deltaproteobacteria bacterium]|nr:autotransporter-associated beta strand repeat-containing protein [Deltaproteobacteria bacterium]
MVADKFYFNGPEANFVYNDGTHNAQNLVPYDYSWTMDPNMASTDSPDAYTLWRLGIYGSLLSYNFMRNYAALTEVEMAAFIDMGYDIDLRNYYGRSIYTGGTLLEPNTVLNEATFFARNGAGTAYLPNASNETAYGVGLHIFGSHNDVTQLGTIMADGRAAAGVRIDGVGNNLTIAPGVTVQANGPGGTAALVAFGSNHSINHRGILSATGENGVGLRIDFGLTGSRDVPNYGWWGGTGPAYSFYENGLPVNQYHEHEYFFRDKSLLNGAAALKVDITGSIVGGSGPMGAAVYIGPGAFVEGIFFMRPFGSPTTNPILGDIITDYDMFYAIPVTELATELIFGYASDASGKSTDNYDPDFDLVLDGKILGYDAAWTPPDWETNIIYQGTQADTFLGRGLFNLIFAGGKTTVNDDVWVNSLAVQEHGTLVVGDGSDLKITGNGNRLVNLGKIVFDVTGDRTLTSAIDGSGIVEKTGAGTLTINSSQAYTGDTVVTAGSLLLGAGGYLESVKIGGGGSISGTGTVKNLTVNGGGVSPGADQYGALTVSGALALNGATLYADLTGALQRDLISAGSLSLSTLHKNRIELRQFLPGLYLFGVLANKLDEGTDINEYFTGVYSAGLALDRSQYALSLNETGNEIWLELVDPARNLTWTGALGGGWAANGNWKSQSQTTVNFLPHDYVIFDDSATTKTVYLSGSYQVGGMEIRDAQYVFDGGEIIGLVDSQYDNRQTGKLELIGSAKATVLSNLRFENGIEIGPNARLVFDGASNLVSTDIENAGTLELRSSALVHLSDAIGDLSGSGNLIKSGLSDLWLDGDFSLATGNLLHQSGQLSLAGTYGGSYAQTAGLTLTVNGDSQILKDATFRGTVNLGADLSIGEEAIFEGATVKLGDGLLGGSLSVGSYAVFNGTTIEYALGAGNIIEVSGTANFQGTGNVVDLNTFTTGVYTILTSSGGLTFDQGDPNITVTLQSGALTGRMGKTWAASTANALTLTLYAQNLALVWNGGSGNVVWNQSDSSWKNTSDGTESFVAQDKATFRDPGPATTVTVSGQANVSGLDVEAGDYTFQGDPLVGTASANGLGSPTGKLAVSGSGTRATFKNVIDFQGGLEIGQNSRVILTESASLGSTHITNAGTLEFNLAGGESFELANADNALSGAGNLAKSGAGTLTLTGYFESDAGRLDHLAGTLVLAGNYRGDYAQAAGTTFSLGAVSRINGDATFRGNVSTHYGLSIEGDATFDGAIIHWDPTLSQVIETDTGVVTVANGASLDLSGFISVTQAPILKTTNASGLNLNADFLVTVNGQVPLARQSASFDLSQDQSTLLFTLENANLELIWNNTAGTLAWNAANWKNGADVNQTQLDGDKVVFDGSHTGTITLSSAATVSDLVVSAGDYVFVGMPITVTAQASGALPRLGQLAISSGASATFENTLSFVSAAIGSGGTLTLKNAGHFGSPAQIANGGTLVFETDSGQSQSLGAAAIVLSGSGSVKKTGDGTLNLSGNYSTTLTQAFLQEAGTVNLNGTLGGAYSLGAGAKLAAADSSGIAGVSEFSGTLALAGRLNLGASALFSNGAKVEVGDLSGSLVAVTGQAQFGGTVTFDLNEFSADRYVLVRASGFTGLSNPEAQLSLTLDGQPLTSRQGHLWETNGSDLALYLFANNFVTRWTASGGGNWDPTSANWSGGGQNLFLNGDKAVFDASRAGSINVVSDVVVSDMLVQSGEFSFSGSKITGNAIGTTLTDATGKLTLQSGANVTLRNQVEFFGGVAVEAGSRLTLTGQGAILPGTVTLGGALVYNYSSDVVPAFAVNGSAGAEVIKQGAGKLTVGPNLLANFSGDFNHQYGEVVLGGTLGGDYAQTLTGALLRVGGNAIIAGNALIDGSIVGSTLRINGDATLNSVSLDFNPSLLGGSPFLSVGGTLTIAGPTSVNIDVAQFAAGTYALARAETDIEADLGANSWQVYVGGDYAINDRQGAKVTVSGDTLNVVLTSDENMTLLWVGDNGDHWNPLDYNFVDYLGGASPLYSFAQLDSVMFDAMWSGTVVVDGSVAVSGMTITGGDYVFQGGGIIGSSNDPVGDRFAPTRALLVKSGATVEFQNEVTFVNGVTIENGAQVRLGDGGHFNGMAITNYGTLTFDRSWQSYELAGHLAGSGAWVKEGYFELTVSGAQTGVTGLLEHRQGTINLNGFWGGSYRGSAGTNLMAGSGAAINGAATFGGTLNPRGTLSIVGLATFDNASLTLDLAEGDLVQANSFSFIGNNQMTVSLASVAAGEWAVFRRLSGLFADADLARWDLADINHSRVQANLVASTDKTELLLKTTLSNLDLEWRGSVDRNWDLTTANWSNGETFLQGDLATFSGAAQGQVYLGGQINVGQLTVSSGAYEFVGPGSINGVLGTALPGAVGGFSLTGGSARLATSAPAVFAGEVRVSGGQLTLGTYLIASGDFTLSPSGTLAFEGALTLNGQTAVLSAASISARDINLSGTLTAEIIDLAAVASNTPYQTVAATASGTLSTAGATLSGSKSFYDYSFAPVGRDLVLTVTPKTGDSGLVGLGGGSTNGREILGSVQEGLKGGVQIGGELQRVLETALAGTPAEAEAIISGLSAVSVAHSTLQTRTIQTQSKDFVNSALGYEPYSFYTPASGAPAAGSPAAGYVDGAWGVKTSVGGRWGRGRALEGDPAFEFKSGSAQLAIEHVFGPYRAGGALLVGQTEADWDNGASANSEDLSGTLFFRHDLDQVYYTLQAFAGRSAVEAARRPVPGLEASGEYAITWAGASATAGRHFLVDGWNLTPRLGMTYSSTLMEGYTETGAGNLNFRYSPERLRSLEFELGAFVSREIVLQSSGRLLTPRLNLGLALETMDTQITVATSFAEIPGLPSFSTFSRDYGRLRFVAESGLDYEIGDSATISLDYRGSFRKAENNHGLSMGLGLQF